MRRILLLACVALLLGGRAAHAIVGITDGVTDDQTITLTGDVTGTGTGSFPATIADNSVDGTDIALGSDAQGDVMYYNGTDWVRLPAGTSGDFLKTLGPGANPQWATAPGAGGGDSVSVDGSPTVDPNFADTGDINFTYSGGNITGDVQSAKITNAKLANMASNTIKGNNTGGSAAPSDLTAAQAQGILNTQNREAINLKDYATCTGSTDDTSAISTAITAATGKALRIPAGCKALVSSPGAGSTRFTLPDDIALVCDPGAGFKLASRVCTAGNFGVTSSVGAPCVTDTGATDGCGSGGTCATDGGLANTFAPSAGSTYTLFGSTTPTAGNGRLQVIGCTIYEAGDTGFNVCVNGTNAGRACKVNGDCAGTGATCGNLGCTSAGFVGATATACCTGSGTGSCGPPGSAHGDGIVNVLDASNASRLGVKSLYVWQQRLADFTVKTTAASDVKAIAVLDDIQTDLSAYTYGTNQTTPPVKVDSGAVWIQGCALLSNSRLNGGLGVGLRMTASNSAVCWPSVANNNLHGGSRFTGMVPGNAVSIGMLNTGFGSLTGNFITGGWVGLYAGGVDLFATNNTIINYPDNTAAKTASAVLGTTGGKFMNNYIVGGGGVVGFTGKDYAIEWGGLDQWQYCTAAGTPWACCTGGGGTGTGCTGSGTPYACCTGSGTGNCWNASTCLGAIGTNHQQLTSNTLGSWSLDTAVHLTNIGRRCTAGSRVQQPCTTDDTHATTGCPVAGSCNYTSGINPQSLVTSNWVGLSPALIDASDLTTSGQGCTGAATPWGCCTGSGTGTCGTGWGSTYNGQNAPYTGSASSSVNNNSLVNVALLKAPATFNTNIWGGSYTGNAASGTFATLFPNWDWSYGSIVANSPPISVTASQLVGNATEGQTLTCSDCDEFARAGGTGATLVRLNGAWVASTTDWNYGSVNEFSVAKNRAIGGPAALQVYGIDAAVNTASAPSGSVTDVVDTTGTYLGYATAASTDSEAGWISSRFNLTRTSQTPVYVSVVKTDAAAVTSTRIWSGLVSATPMAADAPTVSLAGLRYSTNASDTTWQCVTCNGTNCQVQNTGVTVATDTRYILKVSCTTDRCECLVNNAVKATNVTASACTRAGVPAACCTGSGTGATCYFPTTSTDLGYVLALRTLTTAARTLNISRNDMVTR